MTWAQFTDFLSEQRVWIVIIVIGAGIWSYSYFKSRKVKKAKKVDVPPKPDEEESEKSFNTLLMESEFAKANFIDDRMVHLKKRQEMIKKELKEHREMYKGAKRRYTEILALEKSLKESIETLEMEERMYNEEISKNMPVPKPPKR